MKIYVEIYLQYEKLIYSAKFSTFRLFFLNLWKSLWMKEKSWFKIFIEMLEMILG